MLLSYFNKIFPNSVMQFVGERSKFTIIFTINILLLQYNNPNFLVVQTIIDFSAIIILLHSWGPPRIKIWGGGTSDNQARSQHGARGQLPPQIFSLPHLPKSVGLSFRIFVCIHLLCKINVQYIQYILCSP